MRKIIYLILFCFLPATCFATSAGLGYIDPYGSGTTSWSSSRAINWVTPTSGNSEILLEYTDFTLNSGHYISPTTNNRGIIIKARNSITINGIITQTGKVACEDGFGKGWVLADRDVSSLRGLLSSMTTTSFWYEIRGGDGGDGADGSGLPGYSGGEGGDGEPGHIYGGGFGGAGGGGACDGAGGSYNERDGLDGGDASYCQCAKVQSDSTLVACESGCVGGLGGSDASTRPGGAIWLIAPTINIGSTAHFYVDAISGTGQGYGQTGNTSGVPGTCSDAGNGGGLGGAGGGFVFMAASTINDSASRYVNYHISGTSGWSPSGSDGEDGYIYKYNLNTHTMSVTR